MKTYEIESWITVRRLTPGRRSFGARGTKAAAKKRGLATVLGLCDKLIGQDSEQLTLVRRYRAGKAREQGGLWSPEVLEQDVILDRLIVQLRDLLAALAPLAGTARGEAAQELLDSYFAVGVPYYTQAVIEVESERVGELVGSLDGETERVAAATVGDLVADVKTAHARYAELVEAAEAPERVEYATVKAGDLENQRLLLEIVAEILAATRELEPEEQAAARRELLESIAKQDAAVSAMLSARRRVVDVDPETGEPEEGASE